MAADFIFFNDFFERLGKKEIDLNGDTIKAYLTNATPSVSADSVIGDLVGITEEHGYAAADIQNAYTETAGVGTMTAVDVVWTPNGGTFGPFRYVVLVDDTHASKALIGYSDFGAEQTATATPLLTPVTINFGASLLTIAVAT